MALHTGELKKLEAIKDPTFTQRQSINKMRLTVIEDKKELARLQTQVGLVNGVPLGGVIGQVKLLGSRILDDTVAARELRKAILAAASAAYALNESGALIGGAPGRASGGPVGPGVYTVGEGQGQKAETLVLSPGSSGYIVPSGHKDERTEMLVLAPTSSGGTSSGGGSPVVIRLELDGRTVAEVVDRALYYKARRAPLAPNPA